jgi:DNA-binding XRE family transcriptional regulator
MKVEVRAVGLKAMREKRGPTQRRPAHDLGISQNHIPAIEANSRQAVPKVQDQLVRIFECRFEDLFEVVLVDGDTKSERLLVPGEWRRPG